MPASSILFFNSKDEPCEPVLPLERLSSSQNSSKPSKSKHKVLIVDNDQYLRRMAAELLRCDGYEVAEALNDREIVAQAREFKPDIVLTEVVMPEVEGLQLIQELLQLDSQMKIVAVSGSLRAETYLRVARVLGAKATLLKPLTGDALLRTIREITDGRS